MEEFKKQKIKIRPLEPIPTMYEGQKVVLLRDPLRFSDKNLTVSISAYWLFMRFDGNNSIEDARSAFKKEYRAEVPLDDVRELVKMLDEANFLENENFEKHKQAVFDEFDKSDIRKSALAGLSYPDNKDALIKELDGYLDGHETTNADPVAIIAPHIDLSAGGDSFGSAYSKLKNSTADTFVILGTGHMLMDDFFAVTDKAFETPLGVSQVDDVFLATLEETFGEPIYKSAFAHKYEHSVEFQVLFLQKLFEGNGKPRKIVPILLSFPENLDEINHPLFNLARVEKFSLALKKTVEQSKEKIAIIGGIDLSHVGKRFGQLAGATKSMQANCARDDHAVLDYLANGDKDGFMTLMKKVNKNNHICGFPVMSILFDLLGKRKGELLDYQQSVEGDNDSMVSFASMLFPDDKI